MSTSTATVLLYSERGLFADLIRWRTRSLYSHIAVRAGSSLWESRLPGGVREIFGGAAARRAFEAHIAVVVAAPTLADAIAWANHQVGDGYDLVDAALIGLGLIGGERGHWICSAFVAEFLGRAGAIACFDVRSETPASLARRLGVR